MIDYFAATMQLNEFANWFSENYKTLELGTYFSKDGGYCIEYVDKLITVDDNNSITTCTCSVDGLEDFGFTVINMGKSFFTNEGITKNFVFYMVLWCAIVFELEGDYSQADAIALEYYKTVGRPLNDVKIGMVETFKLHPSEENEKRFEQSFKNIN